MLKKLVVAIFIACMSLNAGDGYIVTAKVGKITPKTIEAVYEKHGFKPSENRDMNEPYKIEFGETGFEVYNLYTYYHPEITRKLLTKKPLSGIYLPQSMSIWQRKGEDTIHAAFLKASGMAATLKMDPNDPDLVALEKANLAVLKEAMPGATITESKDVTSEKEGNLIAYFEKEIDPENAADDLLNFQMFFEGELEEKGFAMAGFNDFLVQELKPNKIDQFAFYQAYSICMLKVIYTVAKETPEAGMYAPCTLVNYALKGSDKMVVAHPAVSNWITALKITDKESKEVLIDAQNKMNEALENSM